MSTVSIIIADTHATFTANISAYFQRKSDIEVIATCSSGAQLIALVRKLRPDVVLMDIVLEELDGINALKRLGPDRDGISFIVCTEFVNDASIARASRYGASAFICKPADRAAIYDTICETAAVNRHDIPAEKAGDADAAIIAALRDLGIPAECMGFRLLRYAARRVMDEPALISALTKQLYPQLAEAFHTTPPCIERNIRSAVKRAYSRGMLEIDGKRPTNREIIAHLVHVASEQP